MKADMRAEMMKHATVSPEDEVMCDCPYHEQMEKEKQFNALLQVLAGEQQVIQRTDQKAFTLLSILGVFMVFFIVHFPKIQMNFFNFLMMIIYFTSAMGTIYYLVRVIVPRIRNHKTKI